MQHKDLPQWVPRISSDYWARLVARGSEFLLKDEHSIAILAGADPDGLVAAHFVRSAFKKNFASGAIHHKSFATFDYTFTDAPSFVAKTGATATVSVDIPLIQEGEIVQRLNKLGQLLICDHHVPPPKIATKPNFDYLNPRLGDVPNIRLPSSLYAFQVFCSTFEATTELALPLAAGLLGDGALHQFPAFLTFLQELLDERIAPNKLLETSIGRLTKGLLAWFQCNPGNTPEFWLDGLTSKAALDQFISNNRLDNYTERVAVCVAQEVEEALLNPDRNTSGRLYTHRLRTRNFVSNLVANEIARRFPDRVVLVMYPYNRLVQAEIRVGRQIRSDITEVLNLQRHQYKPLSSGGHPTAAGAIFLHDDERSFVTTFGAALEKFLEMQGRTDRAPLDGKSSAH